MNRYPWHPHHGALKELLAQAVRFMPWRAEESRRNALAIAIFLQRYFAPTLTKDALFFHQRDRAQDACYDLLACGLRRLIRARPECVPAVASLVFMAGVDPASTALGPRPVLTETECATVPPSW